MIWQKDFHIPELWKYFWKIWKIILRIQYLNLINIYSIYSMQYFKKSTSWAARASCHEVLSDIAQDVYRTRLLSDWLWRPVTTWFTEWFMVSKNSEHQYSTFSDWRVQSKVSMNCYKIYSSKSAASHGKTLVDNTPLHSQ